MDKENKLEEVIRAYDFVDYVILDKNNAIIVIINDKQNYVFIHLRHEHNKTKEINRWEQILYNEEIPHKNAVIKNAFLYKVQNTFGGYDAVYNYKEGRFIVEKGLFDSLDFGPDNKYVTDYDCFIGMFTSMPRTVEENHYYASININGHIKNNTLFNDDYDLFNISDYGSLENFKASLANKNKR